MIELDSEELRDLGSGAQGAPGRLLDEIKVRQQFAVHHRWKLNGESLNLEIRTVDSGSHREIHARDLDAEVVSEGPDSTARQVSRYRTLFDLANLVLPHSIRENALDEWMDEIQCAVEAGLPFRRRVISILFRSLPKQALRARLPARARRGEG